MYSDVADFYRNFALPTSPRPQLLDNKAQLYRLARMLEELHEFESAHLKGDLTKAADALADLVYFTLGTAYQMGLPFEEIWSYVHLANMKKKLVSSLALSKYGDDQDIVKPEGWVSPAGAIAFILAKYGA